MSLCEIGLTAFSRLLARRGGRRGLHDHKEPTTTSGGREKVADRGLEHRAENMNRLFSNQLKSDSPSLEVDHGIELFD